MAIAGRSVDYACLEKIVEMKTVDGIYTFALSRKFLFWLFVIALLVLFSTLINRYIQSDDNWFGEQSYWLAKEGTVKLKSIPFIFNWENEFLVYHKFLIWSGSVIVTLFGWSVYYLKAFNLLCLFACMYMMWRYSREEGRAFQYLVMVLILIIPLALVKAFEFRPEVPAMMFGFGSFFFIHHYLRDQRTYQVLVAGLLAGLAFLTHLNGVIYCVSGFFLLLGYRNIKGVVLFSAVAIPVCFIYAIPLLEGNNFELWAYNLQNWPSHSFADTVEKNVLQTLFERIINEQKRFFWDDQVAGISALFILALLMKGKYLWRTQKMLLLYTIFQVSFLALLGSHKAPRYLMLNIPFIVLLVAFALKGLADQKQTFYKTLLLLILVAQFGLFAFRAVKIIERNGPHVQRHNEMLSHIPPGASVIAPWEVIYNEIDEYRIYSYKSYEYLEERMPEPFTQAEFMEKVASRDIEYILIDEEMKDSEVFHWFAGWEVEPSGQYEEFYRGDKYLILKKK